MASQSGRASRSNRSKAGSSRGASRQGQNATGSGALRWFTAGLACGLFVAFLLYMVTLPPETPGKASNAAAPVAVAPAPAPEYEFYEVLPNQSIDVEVDPADIPPPRSASSKQFLLQAGSFRQQDDADRRRAELLLLGLAPRIEETRNESGRWYRVVLGPFESRSQMAKARSLTAQQDIDTLLVQRSND